MSLQEFFAMGGHAVYVWTSFGSVAALMILNWVHPVMTHRKLLNDLRKQTSRNSGDAK